MLKSAVYAASQPVAHVTLNTALGVGKTDQLMASLMDK